MKKQNKMKIHTFQKWRLKENLLLNSGICNCFSALGAVLRKIHLELYKQCIMKQKINRVRSHFTFPHCAPCQITKPGIHSFSFTGKQKTLPPIINRPTSISVLKLYKVKIYVCLLEGTLDKRKSLPHPCAILQGEYLLDIDNCSTSYI